MIGEWEIMRTPFSCRVPLCVSLLMAAWPVVGQEKVEGGGEGKAGVEAAGAPGEGGAAAGGDAAAEAAAAAEYQKLVEGLKYETGDVTISDGLAVLHLPKDWRFLGAKDAKTVIVDLWGNPPVAGDRALGLVIPAGQEIASAEHWAVVVSWDADGYVSDADADEIKYDDLLKQLKENSVAASKRREEMGYGKLLLTGWALPPRYDKEAKVLHWAKSLDSGDPVQMLNYDVRVLGRSGVLSMNAVATMDEVKEIEAAAPELVKLVSFNPGHRYADYVEGKDRKSDYTMAGLVVGGAVAAKVLAKGGLMVMLAKFGKLLIIPVVIVVAWVKRKLSRQG